MYNTEQFEAEQRRIAAQANITKSLDIAKINYVAGIDIIYSGHQAICTAIIIDAKTLSIVEKKHAITKAPIPYIPGYRAFRDGPLIIQAYYDLEHEPDVLFINGHGASHPQGCGVATYVGVELDKPTLGISKTHIEQQNEKAKTIITRQHSNAITISPGHLITINDAEQLLLKTIKPPHKLPEPLHYAHKHARKIMRLYLTGQLNMPPEENDLEEYQVSTGTIV